MLAQTFVYRITITYIQSEQIEEEEKKWKKKTLKRRQGSPSSPSTQLIYIFSDWFKLIPKTLLTPFAFVVLIKGCFDVLDPSATTTKVEICKDFSLSV